MKQQLQERFIRYAKVDTQADMTNPQFVYRW